jgi:hypothetical protein
MGSVVVLTLFQALSFVYSGRTKNALQDFARILAPFSLVACVGILLAQRVSTRSAGDGSDLLLLTGLMGGAVVVWMIGLLYSYGASVRAFRARHADIAKATEREDTKIEAVDQFLAEPPKAPVAQRPKVEPPTSS